MIQYCKQKKFKKESLKSPFLMQIAIGKMLNFPLFTALTLSMEKKFFLSLSLACNQILFHRKAFRFVIVGALFQVRVTINTFLQ